MSQPAYGAFGHGDPRYARWEGGVWNDGYNDDDEFRDLGRFDPAMPFMGTAGWAGFIPWSFAGGAVSAIDRCIEVDYPRSQLEPMLGPDATSFLSDEPPPSTYDGLAPSRYFPPPASAPAMANALPDDYETQRRLAESYQPDLTGPNISPHVSLKTLVDQYAEGHPAYKEKTLRLVQDYSYMRRVKGDRKCGWRAVYFVYCELLLQLGDPQLITAEKQRVTALTPAIPALGDSYTALWEDMSQEMSDLYDKLLAWLSSPDAYKNLEAFFNSDDALHVLYGLRLIAALGMKTREDMFANFLEVPVEDYCNNTLLLPDEEIDETGLRALNDSFLAPAGIKLEVLNLHDNPGAAVDITQYPAPPQTAVGGEYSLANPPTVRLLFTPGHYDIIYAFIAHPAPVHLFFNPFWTAMPPPCLRAEDDLPLLDPRVRAEVDKLIAKRAREIVPRERAAREAAAAAAAAARKAGKNPDDPAFKKPAPPPASASSSSSSSSSRDRKSKARAAARAGKQRASSSSSATTPGHSAGSAAQ